MIYSFTLDTLDLAGPNVRNYLLNQPLEGLDMPDLRVNNSDRPGEDGQILSSALYGGRMITISGSIPKNTCDNFELARKALIQACSISRDSNRYPTLKRISFTTDAGHSYFCLGQVTRMKLPIEGITDFQINIVVPDPMIFGATALTTGQISRSSGGGVIYPVTYPAIYSSTVGGSLTAVNNGTAYTWPTITLRGPLTNPSLYHQQSGTIFTINYAISAGSAITIDMKNKTVLLDGQVSVNLYVDRSAGSDWFSLSPGTNIITFSTGSTGDAGTAEVTYYDAYIGV
jgi:hypothetical protein